MIRFLLSLFALLLTLNILGQVTSTSVKVFSCQQIFKANDSKFCLFSGKAFKIDLMCSPVGSGNEKEVESNSMREFYFEKEHNVAWIKFTASATSKLSISIAPKSVLILELEK